MLCVNLEIIRKMFLQWAHLSLSIFIVPSIYEILRYNEVHSYWIKQVFFHFNIKLEIMSEFEHTSLNFVKNMTSHYKIETTILHFNSNYKIETTYIL